MKLVHHWSLKDQQLFALAGLFLVGGVLGWCVGLPLWEQWRQAREETVAAQHRLEDAQRLAGRRPAVEAACRAYPDAWSDGSASVLQRTWMEELDAVARAQHLRLEFVPRPAQVEGRRTQLQMDVAVEAAQDVIWGLLDRLLTNAPTIRIERLQLAPAASSTAVRASLLLSKTVMLADG